ncbi:hypothetical protein Ahy_B04g070599 isoform C [Arachis hypogaea]|uniref:SWIM-type domain-containing protein n=1 Tax=Arachis hypogaea TaxID=3818 RepID=A0A444ZHV9_ARAHY|nr:hypothetical protein Ahy_B04g070599 isoform C [Arachis hypogaea]
MKEKNQNFFFKLELEDDQSIKLAFWEDARSRATCEYFGDVISFDTTYNTNTYNMVFGSFIGVNQHSQSTLLGCALMKNEDIQSFKWLFECWLCCMGGNAPKGILTVQCALMQRHIMKKIPSKLNDYKRHLKIEHDMSHVVWNSHTKELFDRNWNDFLIKYGFVDNKELSAIEAQFQQVYTHQKFKKVQAQFKGKVNCITRSMNSALGYSVYEVVEQVSNSTFNKFAVTHDSVAAQVKCQCLLFESRGILCRHALSVLSFERVNKVSSRYILKRWSKNVKRRHTHQEQPRRASVGAKKQEVRRIGVSFAKYMRICIGIRGAHSHFAPRL